ncbi:hypothetical protein [Halarchaeum salinum]|uniref:Uncharacterized protein n=1 Tax=Halarchaeum salinum TaxID=489912 RepID=A0AAV3S8S7_9EURY
MTDARARLDGHPELAEWFEAREDRSETIRDALRLLKAREDSGEFEGLDDDQAAAETWLLENVGVGSRSSLSYVENRLAQQLSLDMDMIRQRIVKPLEREGYVAVVARIESVDVVVRPPGSGASSPSRESDESASSERGERGLSEEEAEVFAEARERLESAEPARADGGESA